jgi:hypothetical protein
VSYQKPSNFNQKISGDVFHVWDINNLRYSVVHFIDELTDYQVGDVSFDPSSAWTSAVLRDRWYLVFGPPDLLLTDGGLEFQGSMVRLNEMCGVQHDIVPDQAKWRLGHAERHGAIVKLLMMKMIVALRVDSLAEMQMVATYAIAAKNRLVGDSGMSPLQAVTGRNTTIPGAIMSQLTSGKIKFKMNEHLTQDESLRRAERIRAAAIEACHWVDAHEGIRRALNSRSRPPRLEGLREGACVYVYDPPVSRKGLARRLQDDSSWSGPGVVVCIERDQEIPRRVWVRIRTRVKVYPLEKLRLATPDEMVSAEFITAALKDVEKELESGTLKVEAPPQLKQLQDKEEEKPKEEDQIAEEIPIQHSSTSSTSPAESEVEAKQKAAERRRELEHDVPASVRKNLEMQRKKEATDAEIEPHLLPFAKRQKLFQKLAKELGPPSAMAEAQLRGQMESSMKRLSEANKQQKRAVKQKLRQEASKGATSSVGHGAFWMEEVNGLESESLSCGERHELMREIEGIAVLACEENNQAHLDHILKKVEERAEEQWKAVLGAELVTGKQRLEYQWSKLSQPWKDAFRDPLLKAVSIYFDFKAMQGVKKDCVIDPKKILSSRFVLTNKGEEELAKAILKARWVLGGHRDAEVGKYPTLAPTATLLSHNLLNLIATEWLGSLL